MAGSSRTSGVSRRVKVSSPAPSLLQRAGSTGVSKAYRQQTYGPKALERARSDGMDRYAKITAGLSPESLALLAAMRGEPPPQTENTVEDVLMGDGGGDNGDWEDVPDDEQSAPVQEPMAHALRDLLENRSTFRKYKDARTWRRRVRNLDENWRPLIPQLVDAYLAWKNGDSSSKGAVSSEYDFEIDVLDIYATSQSTVVPRTADDESAAVALVRHGYLGSVPLNPSLAISLKTLELLRIFRLFKPSLSLEAFTKMICYIYSVPYRRYLRTAVSDAFDVYLMIQGAIKKRVQAALGRDTADWRVKHGCPACSYEVEGESPPTYARLLVMDGNNSLKRLAPVGGRSAGDTRTYDDSDYFLPAEYVNKFAGEVKGRQGQQHVAVPEARDHSESDAEAASEEDDDNEADPTDGSIPSTCTSNWKAAATEDKKRMWSVFDECGVFVCACRHSFILYVVDMVRSGELAKYAIAIVAKLCAILGVKLLIGYDIGCAFDGTLSRSSIGALFSATGSRMCVNAFHGYSHAYPCQLRYHPNGIVGVGIEDLETLERLFSASNQLAPITRHASAFRRRMLIDLFFQQWDDEKYQNLGQMLYNNYVQALEIISDLSLVVAESMQSLGITLDQLETLEKEERQYFANLRDEDPWDVHAVAYVEGLQQLRALNEQLRTTSTSFYSTAKADYQWMPPENGPTEYNASLSATRKLETARRALREKIDNLTAEIVEMEVRLQITRRWQPGDQQYEDTRRYIASRQYHKALGKLQRLVVQRLFELHKLNLSQTAYRVRSHIAKNLQKRCKAIRTAVNEYNQAAARLEPPRPALDWSKVSHFSFVEEFTLLQETRNDISDKLWAMPVVRETMRKARRIQRAHEEIANVNREVRRLHTSIRDEDVLFTTVLDDLRSRNDSLYPAALDYCTRRRAANAHNLAYIQRLYGLEGFTGNPTAGVHRNAAPTKEADRTTSSQPAGTTPVDSRKSREPHEDSAGEGNASPAPPSCPASSIDSLTAAEMSAIEMDEKDADAEVDEEDIADIAGLVDHMSNVAVSM